MLDESNLLAVLKILSQLEKSICVEIFYKYQYLLGLSLYHNYCQKVHIFYLFHNHPYHYQYYQLFLLKFYKYFSE